MNSEYKGVEARQVSIFASIFTPFLEAEKFDYIIEIGTCRGGFTRFLKDASPNSFVISYDIHKQTGPEYDSSGIDLRVKNIFNQNMSKVVDDEALWYLSLDKKKLILCDNGHKINEFNCLAKHLKVGDVIMAHDYAPTHEYFVQNLKDKIWNWCEIREDHISKVSEECGLVHYNQEEFQKIVWVCKKKIK